MENTIVKRFLGFNIIISCVSEKYCKLKKFYMSNNLLCLNAIK